MSETIISKDLPRGWVSKIAKEQGVSRVTVWRALRSKDLNSPIYQAIAKMAIAHRMEVESIKTQLENLPINDSSL